MTQPKLRVAEREIPFAGEFLGRMIQVPWNPGSHYSQAILTLPHKKILQMTPMPLEKPFQGELHVKPGWKKSFKTSA